MSRSVGAPLPDEAWLIALLTLDGMGPIRLSALLGVAPPEEAWAVVRAGRVLERVAPAALGLTGRTAGELVTAWAGAAARLDPATSWADHQRAGVQVLARHAPGYPRALAEDPQPPFLLFARGDPAVLDGPRVAVVGTRDCTRYGFEVARRLGRDLAEAGARVISGLALGIDGAAHRGVLEAAAAPPIGVVGSGLDVVYPRRNRGLWDEVAEAGVLLSEYPLGTPPRAWRFPARNRLVATLADAVVVVESAEDGGSMITARLADERGRALLAVPGPVTSPVSAGPHELLATGQVTLARDAGDVLGVLGLPARGDGRADEPAAVLDGTDIPGGGAVLEALGWEPATLDQLVLRTGRTVLDLAPVLAALEAAGRIDRRGGWYERVPEVAAQSSPARRRA